MNLLDNNLWNNPGIILILIIVVFAIIALLVSFIRKLIFKNKKEDKPDEDTIVKEDLASKADFYAKMNISLKEASETEYWLELLHESGYIEEKPFVSIYEDCQELIKILVTITKSQKGAP